MGAYVLVRTLLHVEQGRRHVWSKALLRLLTGLTRVARRLFYYFQLGRAKFRGLRRECLQYVLGLLVNLVVSLIERFQDLGRELATHFFDFHFVRAVFLLFILKLVV